MGSAFCTLREASERVSPDMAGDHVQMVAERAFAPCRTPIADATCAARRASPASRAAGSARRSGGVLDRR
jgi:hypothetical protein